MLSVIHGFTSSWLDYCNGLLNSYQSESIKKKIQTVQNVATRLLTTTKKKWYYTNLKDSTLAAHDFKDRF